MIVPDLNLILYANFSSFPQHEPARLWWEGLLNGQREVGIVPPVLFGFLRIATNRKVFAPPLSMEDAILRVEGWWSCPLVRLLLPGPKHLEISFRLLRGLGVARDMTTDVQIAACAMEYQGEVHSYDTDFARFPGLRWSRPIP